MRRREADAERQRTGFNRLARFYDALLFFTSGNAIHRSQVDGLAWLQPGAKMLLVGGGTGRLAQAIIRALQPAKLVCVDLSGKMCDLTRQRLGPETMRERILVIEADIRSWVPVDTFDAIITPYVLDVFTEHELSAVVSRLGSSLEPGGQWLVADFTHPKQLRSPVRHLQRAILWLLYRFFSIACHISAHTLPDMDGALRREAFAATWSGTRLLGMLSTVVYTRNTAADDHAA